MDTNEYTYKRSPYEDSPYECAWAAPAQEAPAQVEPTQEIPETTVEVPPVTVLPPVPKKREKRGMRPLVAIIMMVAFCLVTALVTSILWQTKLSRMEQAMEERFAALKQIYAESQTQTPAPLPQEGPMTPGQVYAKNVKAVVAVNTKHQGGEGSGSGFFISADGYTVTNYHVINGATKVSVTTYDGQNLEAKVIGYDSANDVALLKVKGEEFPCVTVGNSDKVVVGDQVSAIGNPLGELAATLTVGYVSAKNRDVTSEGFAINMLQTDAAINPGNSGGPLFNTYGEVVGIITAKYTGTTESGATIEGLGFAIPVNDVMGILNDLKDYGYVTGAYLGVYVRDVEESAQGYGVPAGAYVEEPMDGYCAAKAGIRTGDIIINVGGYDVNSVNSLTRVLRRFKAGDTVTVTVYRSGVREYIQVTLDEKPTNTQNAPTQQPETPEYGDFGDIFGDWFPFF